MSVISERFADELCEKEMRDAYLSAQTRTKLTNQIRAIRNRRGWSQGEFAKILDLPQSNVSRLENREYGRFTLTTLLEIAAAFDVGLIVEFVPYEEFVNRTQDLSPKRLEVPSFSRAALQPLCQNGTFGGEGVANVAGLIAETFHSIGTALSLSEVGGGIVVGSLAAPARGTTNIAISTSHLHGAASLGGAVQTGAVGSSEMWFSGGSTVAQTPSPNFGGKQHA